MSHRASQASAPALEFPKVQGALLKYANFLRGWQRRYFLLDSGVLYYFSDYATPNSRGSVNLSHAVVSTTSSDKLRFDIDSGTQILHLRAASGSDCEKWVSAIRRHQELIRRLRPPQRAGLLPDQKADSLGESPSQTHPAPGSDPLGVAQPKTLTQPASAALPHWALPDAARTISIQRTVLTREMNHLVFAVDRMNLVPDSALTPTSTSTSTSTPTSTRDGKGTAQKRPANRFSSPASSPSGALSQTLASPVRSETAPHPLLSATSTSALPVMFGTSTDASDWGEPTAPPCHERGCIVRYGETVHVDQPYIDGLQEQLNRVSIAHKGLQTSFGECIEYFVQQEEAWKAKLKHAEEQIRVLSASLVDLQASQGHSTTTLASDSQSLRQVRLRHWDAHFNVDDRSEISADVFYDAVDTGDDFETISNGAIDSIDPIDPIVMKSLRPSAQPLVKADAQTAGFSKHKHPGVETTLSDTDTDSDSDEIPDALYGDALTGSVPNSYVSSRGAFSFAVGNEHRPTPVSTHNAVGAGDNSTIDKHATESASHTTQKNELHITKDTATSSLTPKLEQHRLSVSNPIPKPFSLKSTPNGTPLMQFQMSDFISCLNLPTAPLPRGADEPGQGANPAAGGVSWKRRDRLPSDKPQFKDISLWAILKDAVGKDLSRITVPIAFCEPLTFLQRMCEDVEYSSLLDKATKTGDPYLALAYIGTFSITNYAATTGRFSKPLNPLLNETFEYISPEQGILFVAEQVSHHPPVGAAYCVSEKGWALHFDTPIKSKFWGKSMEVHPVGLYHLHNTRTGEHYSWNKVTTCIHNVMMGTRWLEHYGEVRISNHTTGAYALIKFVRKGWFSDTCYEIVGQVMDASGSPQLDIAGTWNESVSCRPVNSQDEWIPIWTASTRPPWSTAQYAYTSYAMALNEVDIYSAKRACPTDARYRPDSRALERGDIALASSEKHRLEEKQRAVRRQREKDHLPAAVPRWFAYKRDPDTNTDCWVYTGGYWEHWLKNAWPKDTPEIY